MKLSGPTCRANAPTDRKAPRRARSAAAPGSAGSLAFEQAQPSPHVLVAQIVELLPEGRGVQLGPDQPTRRAGGRCARDRHLGELEAQGEEPQLLWPEPEPDPPGGE